MAEMEAIAVAFEDLQAQNMRLVNQLKDKEGTNLMLMKERGRLDQVGAFSPGPRLPSLGLVDAGR